MRLQRHVGSESYKHLTVFAMKEKYPKHSIKSIMILVLSKWDVNLLYEWFQLVKLGTISCTKPSLPMAALYVYYQYYKIIIYHYL